MDEEKIINNDTGTELIDQTPTEGGMTVIQKPTTRTQGVSGLKIAIIIIGAIVGIFLLIAVIFSVVMNNSKKLECSSSSGSITIMYNDATIYGYMAVGMSYDLDEQKAYAESVGVEAYLKEFNDWFELNTDGTCTKK